ncbi:type II toxin-antitoxin system RelE/ParE family toxin [Algoriphagus sp. D3-2-R+10]|uniref:type II toxin-antitoxin system RelE/ParE family toxin n=1 Tax=Algoriphagus aurantiacus TaxID=3103948 RepID=UPI002B38C5CA|nr:type II toxin-antitoxin system RelE/ParE family toxin [Algoriphagus sp. D3-2-R+10]MEB2777237.1 type II toxin-antitoxin system RelE/ParE family toxin [Algoriphagus sp. D3-2-R+10]
MNFTFVNRPKVKIDISSAVAYYKEINPELAKQFLFRIREAKTRIAQSPLGFQFKYNEVRTIMLNQFPYHVHYLIENSKKQIIILAIIHSHKKTQDYTER